MRGQAYAAAWDIPRVFASYEALLADRAYISLGSNVLLSACNLIGHDGSVAVLNRAYGVKLDAVGPIVIRDNVPRIVWRNSW